MHALVQHYGATCSTRRSLRRAADCTTSCPTTRSGWARCTPSRTSSSPTASSIATTRSVARRPAGSEGTFSMCTFWYVDALTRTGRLDDARLVFEKMLTYANHLGLFAEEIGDNGEQLGNFPQAFTHLSLINAAVGLDARDQSASRAVSAASAVRPVSVRQIVRDRIGPGRGLDLVGRPSRAIRVVVVGGGFGGLPACRFLANLPGRRHADRPAQPPPVPAAAVPSRDRHPLARARSRRRCATSSRKREERPRRARRGDRLRPRAPGRARATGPPATRRSRCPTTA